MFEQELLDVPFRCSCLRVGVPVRMCVIFVFTSAVDHNADALTYSDWGID